MQASRDQNSVPTLLAISSVDGVTPVTVYADPVTHRLLVDSSGGGTGTVTSVSIVTANGFAGSVATATTTPAITLSTTITGILKGNATAISAAVANSDYQVPITLTTVGTSGVATFNGTILNIPNYTSGGGGTVDSVIGTSNRITVDSTDPANPVVNIAATYVGQSSITTLGTIGSGVWNGTVIVGQYGGTGVANTGKTITVSGNTILGSNTDTLTLVTAGNTSVTLPTSGTLVNTAVTTLSSLVSVGTITTGTWNATVVAGQYGGTGVANTGKTITVSGNTTIGTSTNTVSLATTNNTSVTLPTTGTLATLAGAETLTNKTVTDPIISQTVEPSVDDTYSGPSLSGLNAGGTLAQWDLLILNSSSAWVQTDANSAATYAGMLGLATTSGTNGNPIVVAIKGAVVRNDGWTWTPGAVLYMSETAGTITATQPTTTDAAIRVVGFALTDDCIYFDPSPDYITHT